jgi:hypothetical protein
VVEGLLAHEGDEGVLAGAVEEAFDFAGGGVAGAGGVEDAATDSEGLGEYGDRSFCVVVHGGADGLDSVICKYFRLKAH